MTSRETGGEAGKGMGATLSDVLAGVLAGVTRLMQGELALARAETAERLDFARKAAVHVAIAVVLGITAVNLLAAAAVATVVAIGLDPIWASVLVGGVVLMVALGFAGQASRLLRDAGRLSRRSGTSLRRDVETLQTMVKPDAS